MSIMELHICDDEIRFASKFHTTVVWHMIKIMETITNESDDIMKIIQNIAKV